MTAIPPHPASPSELAASARPVADAVPGNWVDRLAPPAARPFLRLARFDRPIGSWLLLFPCWWSLALAELASGKAYPDPWLALLFLIGAFAMRGAGCTWNDIVDRDYDAGVERTRSRPIPSGQVSVRQAALFMGALLLVGLVVLVQLNRYTIALAVASLGLVAIYPFMKRYTFWPQLVLGLTFKWGALVGWAAARGTLEWPAIVLYAGCVLWTIGYDTIYAHQDKEDDLALGLKSTAIRFGDASRPWITGFYAGALTLWLLAVTLAGAGALTYFALAAIAAHCTWQVATLDIAKPDNCLLRFKSNRFVGWILLAGLMLDAVFRNLTG
ncbi:MAG: 4-hydroxybenzoate octaprenyltransferase [Hyphomicrobiaceae bacterium]